LRVLVADDSAVARSLVVRHLTRWGHHAEPVENGAEALERMEADDPPELAVLDWEMPEVTGPEVCRRLREGEPVIRPYLILLTSREDKSDIVTGLDAGADDYLTKPFHADELHARVRVGGRMLDLQRRLQQRVAELEEALAKVRQLEGMLPICAYCKMVRDDQNYWHQVEAYIGERSTAQFSHGVCPDCYDKHLKPHLDE